MDDNSLAHSRYNCTYHIVFIPKYRRKAMFGALRKEVGEILGKICKGVISLYIGKEERDMARIMQTVAEVMRYVHFSDRYTPQEYFELKRVPSEEEQHLYGMVFLAMVHRS